MVSGTALVSVPDPEVSGAALVMASGAALVSVPDPVVPEAELVVASGAALVFVPEPEVSVVELVAGAELESTDGMGSSLEGVDSRLPKTNGIAIE